MNERRKYKKASDNKDKGDIEKSDKEEVQISEKQMNCCVMSHCYWLKIEMKLTELKKIIFQ